MAKEEERDNKLYNQENENKQVGKTKFGFNSSDWIVDDGDLLEGKVAKRGIFAGDSSINRG